MRVACHSNLAAAIKEALTMEQVARFYGFDPNRSGFLRCPFHTGDKTASLKIYSGGGGWHCFGCGKGGSVIDFAMELFGINFQQACLRLNNDFRLGLSNAEPDKKAFSEAMRRRREEQKKAEQEDAEILALSQEHEYWWEVKKWFSPESYDGIYIHPLYAEAVKQLPYLEYRLDEYMRR